MFRKIVPLVVALVLASCGRNASTVSTTTSTTNPGPPTTTTIAYPPGAGAKAWRKWIATVDHVDVSRISKSDCGSFAMVATGNGLTFYMWDGLQWKDVSTMLGAGQGVMPSKIWTLDFTLDGTLDFFVIFDDEKVNGRASYGAYFAFPWTEEGRCKWGWMDVDNGRDLVKTIESPDVDERDSVIRGKGFESSRWSSFGRYDFQSSSSSFVWTKEFSKKNP